jgi:NADH dehydrogenase
VANIIAGCVAGRERPEPFQYFDKGQWLPWGTRMPWSSQGRFTRQGFFGFLMWVFLHDYYLIDFRNREQVLITYFFAYFSAFRRKGGTRIIMLGRKQALPDYRQAPTLDKTTG